MRRAHPPGSPRPRVTIATRPMWRLRLMGAMRRRLLRTLALACVLIAAHLATDVKSQHRAHHTPTAKEQRR